MRALRSYLRLEKRLYASIGLLLRRRRDGVDGDAVAVTYASTDRAMLIAFAAVSLFETGLLWLVDFGLVLDLVLLVLGIYSSVLVFGFYAASVTRPHVVSRSQVRIRNGAFYDVPVPLGNIRELKWHKESYEPGRAKVFLDGVMVVHGASYETNLLLELHEPMTVARPLGRTEVMRTVKFHADDPGLALKTYRQFSSAPR